MTNEECLRMVPLFAGLSDSEVSLLSSQARKKLFPGKQQILWRGEEGETLYVIASGRVKVHCSTEAGGEVTLDILGAGAYFGELSLLDQAPRSADVTAIEHTECVLLRSTALREAVGRIPDLAWRLLEYLAQRVRAQNSSIESLATGDTLGRIALLLLRLADQHGEPWTGAGPRKTVLSGVRIGAKLTRAEIGTFIGASREHVTNIINDLANMGYLTTDKSTGHIVILKPADLQKRAQ